MRNIDFPETNITIAESQEEFNTVKAHFGTSEPENWPVFTLAFQLSEEELEQLRENQGIIYYQQIGSRMMPMSLHTIKPNLIERQ